MITIQNKDCSNLPHKHSLLGASRLRMDLMIGWCQFAGLIVLCFVQSSNGKPCTKAAIDDCLTLFEGYEYEYDNTIVPNMDEESLRQHCKRYDQFEECMRDVKPQCSTVDIFIYDGIEQSYQFMCYDGIDEYLKHRKCFSNNQNLHREGDVCNNTLTTSLTTLDSSKNNSYRADIICQYVNKYLDCVENVVESSCGSDAATWQRTLDVKSLAPLLSAINCTLDGDGSAAISSWIVIVIIVLLVLSIIIIIASVVMAIMQKKRKRRRAAATSGQAGFIPDKSGFVDPPPYQPAVDPTPAAEKYTSVDLGTPSWDGAVEAGYFGVNPAVSSSPVEQSPKKKAKDESAPYLALQ